MTLKSEFKERQFRRGTETGTIELRGGKEGD
jgi:hypothetical protein